MARALETMSIEELETELREQEEKRSNPCRYVEICNFLGREPSLWDLYEQAMMDEEHWNNIADSILADREFKEKACEYATFLDEAKKLHISDRSFSADIARKKALIAKHFPKEYSEKGRDSIYFWDDYQAGGLFRDLKRSAKELAKH